MKIAIASADEQTLSKHFGLAEKYVVYPVENGKVNDTIVDHTENLH